MLYTLCFIALIALILVLTLRHDCKTICGDVIIPYPFGMSARCYIHPSFAVTCNSSSSPPKPILTKLNLEIIQVHIEEKELAGSVWGKITVNMPWFRVCAAVHTDTVPSNKSVLVAEANKEVQRTSLNLSGTPFSLAYNVFASVGCNGSASLYNEAGKQVVVSCNSTCNSSPHHQSMGLAAGWCFSNYYDQAYSSHASDKVVNFGVRVNHECRSAFLISPTFLSLLDNAAIATAISSDSVAPVVLDWDPDNTDWDAILSGSLMIGIPVATILVSCGCFWSSWLYKTKERRKEVRLRAKYFKGRLDEQRSSNGEMVQKTKLYTFNELMRATENFNQNRVIGQGGQGIVYKGRLTNGQVIAVKKSTSFDESQWRQFINEVILLSQINHRNVVKLFGCCVEMKLPLLVYEFVPNGTLSQHIHACSSKESVLLWETRVKIACEVAGAIAYLHSSSSIPIYHRDIKSSNILLDDKYQAKISDFGIAKSFSVDQTHLTTCVKGTFGYLDPEYFRSSQFSEKSDVYSFGVILVELLTGQPPIRSTTSDEEKSLVIYFLEFMNESCLNTILDPIILERCSEEDALIVANIAKRCLNPRGIERPTMREVFVQLESLRKHLYLTINSLPHVSLEIENVASV